MNKTEYYKSYYLNVIKTDPAKLKKHKLRVTECVRTWRKNNPEKYRAHRLVYNARRNGTLKPKKCFCGSNKVEAHHKDYSKPLQIKWLCKEHHTQADMKLRSKLLITPIDRTARGAILNT